MNWWMKLNHLLNPRRMTYAWIAGAALWIAWLLSSILGQGNMDLAGHVVGTDYLQFYSAGMSMRLGQSAQLYDFAYQSQLERSIAGEGLTSFHAFITPPFLAWLYVPLTYLPYTWSFIVWSVLGLILIWASLKFLGYDRPARGLLWSLTWFPIFAAITFGQNSLLSLFLFSLCYYLWRKDRRLLAGVVASLLLYKPQMVLGISIFWLLGWRKEWKSLAGLAIGGTTLAGLCFWFLPAASQAYISLSRDFLPGMIYGAQFPLWHLHSLRGFWTLLLPHQVILSEILSLIFSAFGIIIFVRYWRLHRNDPTTLFAGAICLTIWITPHAMIYDWSILLIPAVLFWQLLPSFRALWKPLFALIWLATFISGPLTFAQLKVLPIAIQISVPIYFLVLYTACIGLSSQQVSPAEAAE